MEPNNTDTAETPPKRNRSRTTKLIPIGVVVLVVVIALVVVSRPVPGQRTNTDTSVTVIVSVAEGAATTEYPITLQEGGDPEHEADHVIEPLQGTNGVSSATLDWSSGAVVLRVEFDPAVVSSAEIANVIAESGYLAAPTK